MTRTPSPASRIRGCLLGGAVAEAVVLADAVGAASTDDGAIHLGAAGQLSLYTADALVEVLEWANAGVFADQAACVWLAFLRWASGQGIPLPSSAPPAPLRWIDTQPAVRRALPTRPTWSSSLAGGDMGTRVRPLGVAFDDGAAAARSAPFGLVAGTPAEAVMTMAVDGASLTHGHASAVQAAAAVALVVRELVEGARVGDAAAVARATLADGRDPAPDVLSVIDTALRGGRTDDGSPAAHALRAALEAALDAELKAESGSGESAETSAAFQATIVRAGEAGPDAAAIAGALLGARWGADAIPSGWAERLDGADIAAQLALTLASASGAA